MIEEDGPSLVDCRLYGDCVVVLKVSIPAVHREVGAHAIVQQHAGGLAGARARTGEPAHAHLGFGRIIASDKEAPSMFAVLV